MNLDAKLDSAIFGASIAIKIAEGFRLAVYPDIITGRGTVGWGHEVTERDGLDLGDRITKRRAEALLSSDLMSAKRIVDSQYRLQLSLLNSPRIAVLIEMAFVLGGHGLSRFTKLYRSVSAENYAAAGCEITDSKWYIVQGAQFTGIKVRVERLKHQMQSGEWQIDMSVR